MTFCRSLPFISIPFQGTASPRMMSGLPVSLAFVFAASLAAPTAARADCVPSGNQITCSGTTTTNNAPAAEAASGQTIVNEGNTTVNGTAPYAIFGNGSGTTLTNNGTLLTTGASTDALEVLGDGHAIVNNGTVATQGVFADALRAVGNRNTLRNTGEVRTGVGRDARAMVAEGSGSRLVNEGSILTQSLGAEGMNASGNDNVLVNSGQIETSGAVGNGIRAYGSRNSVLNAGTVVTRGLEARGIKVDFGTDTRVVNRGSVRTSGIDAFGVWVASTAGQRTTVINEEGGVISSQNSQALKFDSGDERVENFGLLATGTGGMAAHLGAGQDTLLIGATSNIIGYVDASADRDTLVLGGSKNGSLSASLIGPSAQYRNFEQYEKVGSSTWTITGSNGDSMPWAVREGTLMVTGRMSGADMIVSSQATLGGTGTVGSIEARSGSILTPGVGGIGTLNVTGDVRIASGTTYRVDLNAGLDSDRIAAKGAATVQGGIVRVTALPGNYRPGSRWTILSASQGVTGQFSSATTNLAFFKPLLTKDEQNIYLALPRIARTLPDNRPVIDPYLPVTEDELPEVLDLTSGEPIVSGTGVIIAHDDLFRAAVLCRLRCSAGHLPSLAASDIVYADYAADMPGRASLATPIAVAAPRQSADWFMWGKAIGSWGSTDATGRTAAVERSTAGLVAGVDGGFGTPYRIGLAAGYFSTNLDIASLASAGQVESFHIGVYGSAAFGALNLRGGVAYAHHEVDIARSVRFTGFSGTSRSESSADSLQAFGEIGYTFMLGDNVALEPFVGLAHVHVSSRGVREEGSAIAVNGEVHAFDSTFSTLGLRLTANIPTEREPSRSKA